jgi:hypothetical protein
MVAAWLQGAANGDGKDSKHDGASKEGPFVANAGGDKTPATSWQQPKRSTALVLARVSHPYHRAFACLVRTPRLWTDAVSLFWVPSFSVLFLGPLACPYKS